MSAAVKLLNKLVKLEIGKTSGEGAGEHTNIVNLIYMRWDRIHEITPAFVSSQAMPDHWEQGFSHIVWELGLLGYHTAFTLQDVQAASAGVKAYDEDDDSGAIDYYRIFYLDTAKASKYTDFNQAIVEVINMSFPERSAAGKVVSIARGKAFYKTDG